MTHVLHNKTAFWRFLFYAVTIKHMSKYRLYILILSIVGLVIICAAYFTTVAIRARLNDNLVKNYAEQELVIARNVAKTIESEIHATKNQLLLMTFDPMVRSGSTVECLAEIKNNLTVTGSKLGNVGRVGADGNFRCSLNPALVGTQAALLGPYITDIFSDPAHAPVMSRAIKVPGASSYLTALHVPVFTASGEFDGTLGGAVYLNDLEKKYLDEIVFAHRGFVVLVDNDGTILYHKNRELIGAHINSDTFAHVVGDNSSYAEMLATVKQGEDGVLEYENITEGRKVAGFAGAEVLPGRTWLVMVTVPIDDVRTDLNELGVDSLLFQIWLLVASIVIIAEAASIIALQKLVFKPLKQIQEMKSDFVSLASHQLKTPVAQIKGYVANMLDGLTGFINDKQREYLNDMLDVANKNSKLIDDLLNVSRIERGLLKVNIAPLKLDELLNDVVSPLRDVAKKKGVILKENLPKKPIEIIGDQVKTREAIRNIIDNAIKFTEAGKSVSVDFRETSDGAIVTIADEGAGIDPNVQQELFEKNRIWSGKVKASGAGLGLFLSKQFIELTGGTIRFETVQGKGTTFIITFKKK